MGTTRVSINGRDFLINDSLTYAEIDGARPEVMGLLMNARFIQAVFDDKAGRERFNRFGRIFDPEENTNGLIKALPDWYNAGLRAITVGFQGGGTCYTINSQTIDNNPFGSDGRHLDPAYASRMDRLIRACDRIGMVVIVSFFYWMQALRFSNENALLEAMKTACAFLRERKYTNVLIEIANEHDIFDFQHLSIVRDPSRMAGLIRIARDESGSLPVGCSGSGGKIFREICDESDFILIHGNGCSRQILYNLIQTVREWAPDKPVVCAMRIRQRWGKFLSLSGYTRLGDIITISPSKSLRSTGKSSQAKILFSQCACPWHLEFRCEHRLYSSTFYRGWNTLRTGMGYVGYASRVYIRKRLIMWSFLKMVRIYSLLMTSLL